MNVMPVSFDKPLRRLARRIAIGLFLDVWPTWAVASLLLAGFVALICRLFVPSAAPRLPWLWLTPVLAALPALAICVRRAYRPDEIVALADSLTGGHGTLMALHETNDLAWRESVLAARLSTIPLPRLRPWRKLAILPPALAFMAAAFWLPQRLPQPTDTILADEIAATLTATIAELKQQELMTDVEEERLAEEIARLRRSAKERVDASSWEAADTLRDKIVARVSEKQDAVKWAEESLARYAAASQDSGAAAGSMSAAQAAELTTALQRLAQRGLLAGAPADVQRMLSAGKLPTDAASLRKLMATLSKHLADTNGRFARLARLGKGFGRFDPSEFPVQSGEQAADGNGKPGKGGVTRGRGDAPLTWGKETSPFDRFKAATLPPGAARSPEDWAPVTTLPGAPEEGPVLSTPSADRYYAAVAGQSAWRRTLAPRHQSAVKKYFAK
jgi:hypothetical protein